MALTWIILLPFLGSVCAALLPRNAWNAEAWLAVAVSLGSLTLVGFLYPPVLHGEVARANISWVPQLGLGLTLRMDGFAWVFCALVTGIGALVVLYARYYMSPADPVPRFFSFLLAFMGAMLGVVLSGNLIQLVVFWELTSFTSFMLIAYWYHRAEARRGAAMALLVTAFGGLCLLAAVLMLRRITGSYELDVLLSSGDAIRRDPWYPAILILVLVAAFTKSAQFPFHFWLPHAMAAPTPVSAYLHSATMVKAGVFLLARLWPVLSGSDLWFGIVCTVGLASLLLGAIAATFQRDMKGVLAYSTVSHLGLITLLLGMNSRLALVAAVFHMMNHATFKASLFMAAGIVDHESGTRDLVRLRGLARAMPITATLATVAAAAMAGVPLLNGFLSKEMFFSETIFAGDALPIRIGLPVVATLAGVFSVAYSVRLVHRVFMGPLAADLPRTPHEPAYWMLVPSALLVVACVLVGTLPVVTIGPYLNTAMRGILGTSVPAYSLAVWHGFTTPLLMSALALAGGIALYTLLYWRWDHALRPAPFAQLADGKRNFEVLIVRLIRSANRTMHLLYSPRLQTQLAVLAVTVVAIAATALRELTFASPRSVSPIHPAFALLGIVGSACAIGAALQAKFHRLAALIMVGGTGLLTCLTFAWFSAPDLALTQISVEVVTLVLVLLGLRWLPKRLAMTDARQQTPRARLRRARDFALAGLSGIGMAGLSYAMLTRTPRPGVSAFYLENALPRGGGHNVVNVILVDFRGFDTLGEITVVGIVALTVYKLLRRFRPAPESIELPQQKELDTADGAESPNTEDALPRGYMRAPAVFGSLLLPVASVVSVFFLLRGHDAPGGGFVAGLILSIAFIVQYMVFGTRWVESRIRIHPQYWMAAGLLSAATAGSGAWLLSRNFLTSLRWDLHLRFVQLHLSSTFLFDIGVFLLVVGATGLMLIALAHQSLRSRRKAVPEEAATSEWRGPSIETSPEARWKSSTRS
jgi:multicomponent K+:H+ antiporter subunit A